MLFTNEHWNHCDYTPHGVTRVDFDNNDIRKAFETAQKKLNHTGVDDPGGHARTHPVMMSRIVAGELADQAVAAILNSYYQLCSLPLRAIEYDDFRSDNFQNPSPYSILIQNSGTPVTKTAEVRSSFCYRLRDAKAMLNKLSIYGWYTSYGKPKEDLKDLYFQVYFHLKPENIVKEETWPDIPIYEECLRNGKVTGYVIGGADITLLSSNGVTKKDDVTGAFYQAIFPADAGHDIYKMCDLSAS